MPGVHWRSSCRASVRLGRDGVPVLYRVGWGCHPGRVRPRIRYCATPAGRVAYSTTGAGPALLCDSGWITDLCGQLELFSFGSFIERLAERFTVIRYDKPGCGLSDREGADLSFDGQVAAALAVADAVGARRFRLFGASQGGQLAAAIAARYPDKVEALVLYGMCASGSDLAPAEVRKSVVALVRAHWGLGLKALAGAFVTDPTAEDMAAFTRFERASASAAVAARLLEVYYDTDIRALLGDPGAYGGAAPRGGQGHQVRAGVRGCRADPGCDADPAAGFEPPVLPRRLASGPGCDARLLLRAREPGAAADRP